jgi:hypothetical protein
MHCVCMCVCVYTHSTEKVGILITVLQINVTKNAFIVTISKTCWQYEVIWCGSSLVSTSSGFECCSRQEELGALLLLQKESIF